MYLNKTTHAVSLTLYTRAAESPTASTDTLAAIKLGWGYCKRTDRERHLIIPALISMLAGWLTADVAWVEGQAQVIGGISNCLINFPNTLSDHHNYNHREHRARPDLT